MKKNFLTFSIEGVKQIANTLSGEAKQFADAVIAAFESAEAEEVEHDITSLKTKIEEIAAQFAKQDEEVAEKLNRVKNEILAKVGGAKKDVKDAFTPQVRNAIAHAIFNARSREDGIKNVLDIAEKAGVEVMRTKNDLTGLSFEQIVDYAIQFKQDDSDDIFDALYKTNRTKFFCAEIDESDKDQIAKQWLGVSVEEAEKAIQEVTVEGKTIDTKMVYKRQRVAVEDMIDAAEHGQESALQSDVRTELRRGVKGVSVRAILIGDVVNPNKSKITCFETIGTKKRTDLFTTVINPAVAGAPVLADFRKAAAKVKTATKWIFMTEDLKLALATRIYAAGGTQFFFTDDELAAQLGVNRIITKDYIANEEGLHAVILDPNEYWVKVKQESDVAWPKYEENAQHFMYEMYMGGAIHGLQSTAVLREATGSSAS